jgi:hypothetical protein
MQHLLGIQEHLVRMLLAASWQGESGETACQPVQ